MREKLFGTDGMRGLVGSYPMTPEVALRLGLAAGTYFRGGTRRHKVVIGKDTRLSGYVFETALTSGFCASGMDVILVGPMPTPAIAFLTKSMRADVGVVISASHNPFQDNGIKFFDHRGIKLPDEVESEIAKLVLDADANWAMPAPDMVGRAVKIEDSPGRYNVFLKNTIPQDMTFDGLRIVLDCAHGAAYRVAPPVLEELGAKVFRYGVDPNGTNINNHVGSLYPDVAAKAVLEHEADVGISLDGDADRVIMVDEKGRVLDGDQLMAICAGAMLADDCLPNKTLVATVMSNMALEVFMDEQGGRLLRTPVGDRYVIEAMMREGAALGGEQSGHLISKNHSTTGDGLLAAMQVIRIMIATGKPLSELAGKLIAYPQKLVNVLVAEKKPFEHVPAIGKALEEAQQALAGKGRVLLRYSGTESKCRVMVEAKDEALVEKLTGFLADAVANALR